MALNRTTISRGLAAVAGTVCLGAASLAQNWGGCLSTTAMPNPSDDWLPPASITTPLMTFGIGFSGNATFGPQCGFDELVVDQLGSFYFGSGPSGSLHDSTDDGCVMVMGMPFAAQPWSFVTMRVADADGGNPTDAQFLGTPAGDASQRRLLATDVNGDVAYQLKAYLVGASLRMEWTLTNTGADPVQAGLRFGSWSAMQNLAAGASGFQNNNYVVLPTGRPIVTETAFRRAADPTNFPKYVDLYFRQSRPYPGIRILMERDSLTQDQTNVDRFIIANKGTVLGPDDGPTLWEEGNPPIGQNAMGSTAWAIYFEPQLINAGASRTIVYYLKMPWAVTDTTVVTNGGFAVSVEAPMLIESDPAGLNGLGTNPFFITAWVDNQYARVTPGGAIMNQVNYSLTLPPGISFAPGEQPTKVVPTINPNQVREIRWQCIADGSYSGLLPYTVKISAGAAPSFNAKTIQGVINISTTPKINVAAGPNLVGMPWAFANANIAVALGLATPADFSAFNWNVVLQAYENATIFERGRGTWVVATSDFPGVNLAGASAIPDEVTGLVYFTVRRGWNLIANPFRYGVQLNQLNGNISASGLFSWSQLVSTGRIRNTLFRYDPLISDYRSSSSTSQIMLPGVGYWVYVASLDPIELQWPPVFAPGLPGSNRSVEDFAQMTESKWRLQLSARGQNGGDAENYIGVVGSASEANLLTVPEPPMAPNAKVSFSIVKDVPAGEQNTFAQDYRDTRGKIVFNGRFAAAEGGTYTISWPNVNRLPRTLRARILDKETNISRDMRMSAGYTFTMGEAGTRSFEIIIEPGTAARAVIGNVMVTSAGRDQNSNVTIQYGLSTGANVSVRILGSNGKEVYAVSRGRAENAGVNTATWTKRDSAGRAVAPGNYVIEIVAETSDGQRVRVTKPVVIVR